MIRGKMNYRVKENEIKPRRQTMKTTKSNTTKKENFPATVEFLKKTRETIREFEIEVNYDLFVKFM